MTEFRKAEGLIAVSLSDELLDRIAERVLDRITFVSVPHVVRTPEPEVEVSPETFMATHPGFISHKTSPKEK